MYVWFLLPTYPNFFNPTLNIKMVFGEKIPKMDTFSDFVIIFFVKCYKQNLIISLPTYPKFCWYATGTTHIFHLGLVLVHPKMKALEWSQHFFHNKSMEIFPDIQGQLTP